MKVILLYITMLIISINCVFSQTRHFFDDISSMKISLCSKGYILSNNNMLMPLKHDWTSQQVFFKADSSEFVMVRLHNRTNALISIKKTVQNDQSKYLAKFGAHSGFWAMSPTESPKMIGDYISDFGAVLFGDSGLMSISVFRNKNFTQKRKEKDFVEFASNFIHFMP